MGSDDATANRRRGHRPPPWCMHACNGKTAADADNNNNNTRQTKQTNNNIGQGEKKQSTGAGLQAWRKGHCGAAIFWLLLIL